jgi:hypothetical protein
MTARAAAAAARGARCRSLIVLTVVLAAWLGAAFAAGRVVQGSLDHRVPPVVRVRR